MFQPEPNIKINEDNELDALVEFVSKRWEGYNPEDLKPLIEMAWDKGLNMLPNRFDPYFFSDIIIAWTEERRSIEYWKDILAEDEVALVPAYDNIYQKISSVLSQLMNVQDHIMKGFDYSRKCSQITASVKEAFPESAKMKPIGWDTLVKNYSDFDGQEDYCKNDALNDMKDFKGVNSDGAGATGFHGRVVLPYVMYDEECQGRKAFYVLISAIVGHAMFVRTHNNSVEMLEELTLLKTELEKIQYKQEIQYSVDIQSMVKNKVLKAGFALYDLYSFKNEAETKEKFQENIANSLNSSRAYDVLSEDEKKIREEEGKIRMKEYMKDFNKPKTAEQELEYAKKKELKTELIMKFLNDTGTSTPKNKM